MWSATPLKWFLTSSPAEDGPYWLIRPCAQTTSFSQGEQYYAIRPVFISKAQRACSMVASKGFGRGRPTVECERTSYSQAEGAGGGRQYRDTYPASHRRMFMCVLISSCGRMTSGVSSYWDQCACPFSAFTWTKATRVPLKQRTPWGFAWVAILLGLATYSMLKNYKDRM